MLGTGENRRVATLDLVIADLHAHTLASDGTDTPTQLVEKASAAGLDLIAITDHDTTSGWDEAASAAERNGIALLRGIEISCQWRGISLHLLAYLHDPHHEPLLRTLHRARESRERRARRITELLAADVPVDWKDVSAQVEPGATVGRPHIADALVTRGVVPDRDAAFAQYLYTGSPYYASHYAPGPVEVVNLVRAARGVPVMAHPFAAARGPVVPDELIADMAQAGLFALEAHHPDHRESERDHALALAAALQLHVTGASDYHGRGKANRLGQCTTSSETLEALLAEPTALPVVGRAT